MKKFITTLLLVTSLASTATAHQQAKKNLRIPMYLTAKSQVSIGYIDATNSRYGLLLTPHLHSKQLTPGVHGFHIHIKPSCGHSGKDAGGHLDPQKTGKHLGPYDSHGHLGDLPVLIVNPDQTATIPVLAPRLTLQQIIGHSLMIHAGGDNYSDQPAKLGGGGSRLACGVIGK